MVCILLKQNYFFSKNVKPNTSFPQWIPFYKVRIVHSSLYCLCDIALETSASWIGRCVSKPVLTYPFVNGQGNGWNGLSVLTIRALMCGYCLFPSTKSSLATRTAFKVFLFLHFLSDCFVMFSWIYFTLFSIRLLLNKGARTIQGSGFR